MAESGGEWSVRGLQRELATRFPAAEAAGSGTTLELVAQNNDAPRLIAATVIEGTTLQAHGVEDAHKPGFRAFLDGTQRSQIAVFLEHAPIVLGHVAAVIRERIAGRMRTWQAPLEERRIYAPRAALSAVTWNTLASAVGDALVDTTDTSAEYNSHPFALRDAAFHRVQAHREQVEQRLAERWCSTERDALFIDGGISGSERVAVSAHTVGVVKSHRTLYAEGAGLAAILALRHRERSSVFRITSPKRTTVASWYLRLRDQRGHDPMWGLVRAEIAVPAGAELAVIGDRANDVSGWILAEVTPLALPDARWDKMVYGVRDCEEFLRAIQ